MAVMGDFGRTPKINGNDAGRDHWNYCYSLMLVGGGIQPGLVYGASDKTGAFPADRPTTPGDIIATIYQLLGIRPAARPVRPIRPSASGSAARERGGRVVGLERRMTKSQ